MGASKKELTPAKAAAIFISFTAYFYVLLFTLLPFLKAKFDLNPALYWFITGYFLFVPLLKFAAWRAWAEGNRGPREIMQALHLKPFTSQDWKYSILGLLLVLMLAAVKREPERAGMESGGFSDWIEDGMAAAANLKQTGAELRG